MNRLRRKRKSDTAAEDEEANKKILDEPSIVSNYFIHNNEPNISTQLLSVANSLNLCLKDLKFSAPIKYVYNPTIYAYDPFMKYIQKYGNSEKHIVFIGMNPGPFGMSQTGVPFGEINAVKNWLKITGVVGKPEQECSKRQVLGFDCARSEVSGKRFWGLAETLCGTPELFFKNSFVYNHCPLQFIAESGANITPADMKIGEREKLNEICDRYLVEIIQILRPKIIVAIGSFAEKTAKKIFGRNKDIRICCIPHPSPRAVNNTDWNNKTIKHLESLNLIQYFSK